MGQRSDEEDAAHGIVLRTAQHEFRLRSPAAADGEAEEGRRWSLASESRRWSAVLRGRERWSRSAVLLKQQERDAAAMLHAFGLDDAALRELATAGRVVVVLPYAAETTGWEGRTFPWEFVLARATRAWRTGSRPLTVMRELQLSWHVQQRIPPDGRWPSVGWPLPAPRVMFVHSFPGSLEMAYETHDEQQRVRQAFGLSDGDARWCLLQQPTLQALRQRCAEFRPDVVHFSGFDNHEGLQRIGEADGPDALVVQGGHTDSVRGWLQARGAMRDGCLMRSDDGLPQMVLPQELAGALVASGQPPYFVGLNLPNSAARLAPLLLPAGVLAALGFQDTFDPSLSAYLFENLYGRLDGLRWDLPAAFEQAWAETRRQPDLVPGTGIALWARAPLVQPFAFRSAPVAPMPPRRREARPAGPPVELVFSPRTEINYAELHNNQPLFERFELRCPDPERAPQVTVAVLLDCGLESARFDAEFKMVEPRVNMNQRIRLPLTAALLRTASEALRSTLQVRVSVDDKPLWSDTYALRLLPVDQWRDNEVSGRWLPSFVFPRDPAVQAAVTAAQRYVRIIRDDPNAGFEGYQALLGSEHDSLDAIDLQVEAIWDVLLHDWQLGYVNPPPTYSADRDSQRLRTPSAIHSSRMGTCIDLAAAFAACLELIDIYPVIILLDGHALPGYWRDSRFNAAFRGSSLARRETGMEPLLEANPPRGSAWEVLDHDTVWAEVRAGRLAPLETVRLTEHCGFREARQAGIDALREPGDFDRLLDIATARDNQITPLPMLAVRA